MTLTPASALAPAPEGPPRAPVLDVVIPVHNEAATLEASVRRVRRFLDEDVPYPARVTVVDNASTDGTDRLAARLARDLPGVAARHLEAKGRGRALRAAWLESDAAVLVYMDVDLSTDLSALLPLVAPLVSGHSHLAVGTRLARGSRVVRGPKREVISRGYNLLLRGTLALRVSDAQCGFKAIRADVARELLPLVHDTGWFFDTELLVLAERAGLRIHEVPVDWVDDPDSRVDVVATALADLRGIARVGRDLLTGRLPLSEVAEHLRAERDGRGLTGQLIRFATVGVASTAAFSLLYLLLASPLGPQGANLVALLVTAVANTATNRRITFGVRGRRDAWRHHVQGLAVFVLGWVLTAGSLAVLDTTTQASRVTELAVLALANLTATVLRFTLLRHWVFRTGGARTPGRTDDRAAPDPAAPDPAAPHPTPTWIGAPR
ncbi:bifunctional glycosyltransferase family 2/GtrA family protein [Isoptericola sp. b441]|uniref:dolichyl-phosphate beta-glucosyltransferase n=1 Tax=Actinotalea lenta TaxID=3064654 RepID=A0ABT9D7Y0_9CELL|nr:MULTISPECIES: bifunctional glycosyltransferase family 2/GtrA family protein [unclassified Isoptericola]MDO8106966.1 bifunctional glycosyltransferase family 2/GtrA family protein [Isoptericola sp. b441]MDO8121324.1 bifunctional glycosyltransferase family 2/GtrA family protein [Isoptericola sp. b490]